MDTTLAEGGKMQWINSRQGYGWLSIILHWVAAIAVITMLVIGFRAELAGDAGDREMRSMLMGWHISLGASFALILLARVFASYAQPRPPPPEQAPILKFLSSTTHQILLLAILVQVISGPLAVWSGGRAINVFDLFTIPTPFAERNEGVHEFAEFMHNIGRWALVGAITLHVLGAFKHMLIDRDGIFERMFAPPKS
jgi:cytochrome b561